MDDARCTVDKVLLTRNRKYPEPVRKRTLKFCRKITLVKSTSNYGKLLLITRLRINVYFRFMGHFELMNAVLVNEIFPVDL